MWPVWNGDETEWAFDSCLLGHYRYVSFPGLTVPRPKRRPAIARSCRPSRSSPRRHSRQSQPAAEARLDGHPERAQGFCLPDRADADGRFGNGCRQGAGSDQRRRCRADRAHGLAEHRGRAAATGAGYHHQRYDRQSIYAGHTISWFRCIAGRRHSAGAGGLPERDAHQRSVRRHRQLGLDPDRRDQVGYRRDQQPRVRPQCARRSRQRADEGWLQLSRRRNQHDGRLVRAHPEFGAVWQADRQLVGLWRARRRARQRLSQFFGIGDPALLWRCRLPDR